MASSVIKQDCRRNHDAFGAGGEAGADVAELGAGQTLSAGHVGGIGAGEAAISIDDTVVAGAGCAGCS